MAVSGSASVCGSSEVGVGSVYYLSVYDCDSSVYSASWNGWSVSCEVASYCVDYGADADADSASSEAVVDAEVDCAGESAVAGWW